MAVPLLLPPVASAQTPTTTTVAVVNAPITHGQRATVRANVTASAVGSVQFKLDGADLGMAVPLTSGGAQTQTPPLTTGTHTVQAFYLAGPGFVNSDGSVPVTVGRAATSATPRITPSVNGVAGQYFDIETTVKAVTSELAAPAGTVSYFVYGVQLGTYSLDGQGVTRISERLPAASVTFTASYSGDMNHLPSVGTATVTINKAGTVIALSATPATPAVNESVEVRAMVDSIAPSMWSPTGSLSAAVDGQPLPSAVAFDGTFAGVGFRWSFATPGPHRVTAHFSGDDDFLAADAALDLTVAGTGGYENPARRRVAPRGLTLKATPARDRRAPFRFTAQGALQVPSSVTAADVGSGTVQVEAKIKGKRVARKVVTLTSKLTYKATLTVKRKGAVSITASFGGNAGVSGIDARAVKVKAG